MKEIFKEIGLTESESSVYLALLNLGDATRGSIVNKSKIAGSKVYEILEKLQDKGLVSIYTKNNVKHFKPLSPKQLLIYIEEKKKKFNQVEEQINLILPNLLMKFNSSKEEQEVELFSGLKGLEVVFRDQIDLLNKGETCFVIGGTTGIEQGPMRAFFEKIHLMRETKKIKTKMLFNKSQKKVIEDVFVTKKVPSLKARFIPHTSPVAINIYADRTLIIIYGKKVTGIHIKSKDVAQSFKEYFNILWKQAS